MRTFEEDIEEDQSKDLPPAGSCGSSVKPNLERKERIYRDLFRELRNKPMDNKSCIREAVSASSTDNYPEESIVQTLHPRPRYHDEQTPSYWSSTGQRDVNHPETLTYNLVSQLCVVHEVRIRPFKGIVKSVYLFLAKCIVRNSLSLLFILMFLMLKLVARILLTCRLHQLRYTESVFYFHLC